MSTRLRSVVVTAFAVVAAALVAGLLPLSSAEASSYRFWIYWTGGDGDWTFSNQGAARRPADGTVDGWRFAVSQESGSASEPRIPSTFEQICGSTEPVEGKKRVGLVIDFGTKADAPSGETPPTDKVARCVVAPLTATGYDILVTAAAVRVEEGMVCGIAGYPRSECGEPVADPDPTNTTDDAGTPDSRNGSGEGSNSGSPSPVQTEKSTDGANPDKRDGNDKESQRGKQKNEGGSSDSPTTEPGRDDVAITAATQNDLPSNSSGSPVGLVVGATIGAALLTGAVITAKRRKRQP